MTRFRDCERSADGSCAGRCPALAQHGTGRRRMARDTRVAESAAGEWTGTAAGRRPARRRRGTGRTPSAITTTSPIRKAAFAGDPPRQRPRRAATRACAEPRQRSAGRPVAVSAVGAREATGVPGASFTIRSGRSTSSRSRAARRPGRRSRSCGTATRSASIPATCVFLFDSGTRIIHLDGKPHLPATIKLWNADSRGRWEGNTLIVDVANNNAKARFARTGEFVSENAHIQERFIFDPTATASTTSPCTPIPRVHAAVDGDDSQSPHHRADAPGRLEQRDLPRQPPRRRADHRSVGTHLRGRQREPR